MSAIAGLLPGDSSPGALGERLAIVGVLAAAAATVVVGGWLVAGMPAVAGGLLLLAGCLGGALIVRRTAVAAEAPVASADWSILRTIMADARDAVAVTSRAGRLICVSDSYETVFDGRPAPRALAFAGDGNARLTEAARVAWRDGGATCDALLLDGRHFDAVLRRSGVREDVLSWRFREVDASDLPSRVAALCAGEIGRRLGEAGTMLVLADAAGRLIAANAAFAARALGERDAAVEVMPLVDLLRTESDGTIRMARDDTTAPSLRIVPIPLGDEQADDDWEEPTAFLILDEDPEAMTAAAARGAATVHLHGLLAMLPLGLALVERDGRFLFLNDAFRRAAGIGPDEGAVYPSDLVVEEDKATVSDAVRRFAAGRALPGDLDIRLKHKAEETVSLTIANAKGLGEASVLLSLKDNSEESTLKRQVAQATKMQAVGQLAGGVAHDFNNILTAIIGHCDLMAMRHTPGDIDYDDIQQIRNNSNRAASLTRQLLAFSRQQTLRPQILQLPEVMSEISSLLRRLLGETVKLEVKHGRNLGLVRADPGQLEQVIVNLAVNARDAMPDGGLVTIQTYAVTSAEVRRMRSEIMPIADYTALKVQDTGTGIPADVLPKIFEPFFTTKEVGKGTGLGLSTVYGIVKQTDGYIFADSEVGHGTSFTIYLPVHHAAQPPAPAPVRVEPSGELWGTGTILLVEDEAMVRAVAERALTRQGYTVLVAANGEEALELLDFGQKPDLLVSDVVMPAMDGPTLVGKARERFPDLKILFMSGYAEEQLRKSIDVDHVSFLSKPFSVQQLGQAARDALAAPI